MDTHVIEVGARPDAPPGVLETGEMVARLLCRRITQGWSSSRGRESSNRTAEGASGTACLPVLGIRQVQLVRVKIGTLPTEFLDLR